MKKIWLIIILLVVVLLAVVTGRYPIDLSLYIQMIQGDLYTKHAQTAYLVLTTIRFPRIVTALLTGSSLSLAGVVYQGIFKNPMVSPALLGASSGSAFGAALAIVSGYSIFGIEVMAFVSGVFAVIITVGVSSIFTYKNGSSLVLVLTGILVSTVFTSLISLIKYFADPYNKLPDITFWLLGSVSGVNGSDALFMIFITAVSFIPILVIRWKLNILSLSEDESKSLGVSTNVYKILIIVCATLLTSAAVSVCGLVGWIGLVVPHMVRMMFGPDYRILVPMSIVVGAIYLLSIDTIARSIVPGEIPLGIVTSLIGAPFFMYLMIKKRWGWY